MIAIDKVIRGVEVTVYAHMFDGDESVGIYVGPGEVWAETIDGEDFELTDDEYEQLIIETTDCYLSDDGPC